MVAIKSFEADRFLDREIGGFAAYLVFGTDLGLVSERVRKILKALVDDPADPFQSVRLSGDALADDPGRLADEAGTIPMFGGRRVIHVTTTAKSILPALEHHLSATAPCPVVIEAGGLKKDAPLRKLVERAKTAVALECFPDGEADYKRLIDTEVAAAGLTIDADAKAMLAALLGADRLASRAEVAKLTLYAHGRGAITADDVEAVVADAAAQATDALIDAAFLGDIGAVEHAGRRVLGHGGDAGQMLQTALRHAIWLHRAKLDVAAGAAADEVLRRLPFGTAPRRRAGIERQLRARTADDLGRAVMRLGEAVGRARREPVLAQSLALRTLWAIARSGRSAG